MTTRKDLPARFAIRVLALVLSVSLAGALPGAAHADEGADAAQRAVDDAASALDRAESRMSQLVSECQEIGQEVERLQAQIDEAADQVLEAQQEVIEGREALGRAAAAEYAMAAPRSRFWSWCLGQAISPSCCATSPTCRASPIIRPRGSPSSRSAVSASRAWQTI